MKSCNCYCSFIPPHIMEELLKKKDLGFLKESIDPDFMFRERRRNRTAILAEEGISPITGNAGRKIYDCQHTTNLDTNVVRSEGQPPVQDAIANTGYDNGGKVRDFYKHQYNYHSFDNRGSDFLFNIHYSNRYNNAFWDGTEMIFGDGDGVVFTNFVNALDVTGHELTHGVVQYTARLIYNGQPGALNEHFADVFGVTIRQFYENQSHTPKTANWLVGDSIMGPTLQGQAIRSMKAPGTAYHNRWMGKDPQPEDMAHYYNGAADNHGVHINSGIPNRIFYLVSVGFNDTLKAALLWFETLKILRPNDSFLNFKARMHTQSTQLAAAHKIPANANAVVTNAFHSVGL